MKLVSTAFVNAQKAFSPALKTKTNPHFRTQYVGLEGCIEAVIDALGDNGIALMQKSHNCENGIAIETLFIHESGEVLSGGVLKIPANKQDPQGYGSAMTYARRYSLMAACGIAPEDDDGSRASTTKVDFDIKQALDYVDMANTIEILDAVWLGESAKATTAKDVDGFKQLKNACKSRKEQLQKEQQ